MFPSEENFQCLTQFLASIQLVLFRDESERLFQVGNGQGSFVPARIIEWLYQADSITRLSLC